jgi:NDP-sugar pyrophosphorylase family protein
MLLAAGVGERMRPLTDGRAKPSLPLLNRPIIAHTLAYLKSNGVDEVVINLHHHPESIRGIVGDGARLGVKVHYSEELVILGTSGGLKKAEEAFRSRGTFILINGDFVIDCALGPVIEEHRRSGAQATMILTPHRPGTAYGNVEISGGRVVSIGGPASPTTPPPDGQAPASPAGGYTFTGIHLLEPSIFDRIPAGVKSDINRDIYPPWMKSGALIRGWVHQGRWFEMGTPRLYLEGNLALLTAHDLPGLEAQRTGEGTFLDHVALPAGTNAAAPYMVGKGSTLGAQCSLQGGVVIGRQCQIGSGCALRSSMLWDGARLGDRVQLTDCIVTSGVFVPPMTSLSGRILFRVEGYQGRKENLERVGSSWASRIV